MEDILNSEHLDNCYTELERKQAALIENYQLDSYGSFDFNMHKGTIEFKQGSDVKVTADFAPVGSYSSDEQQSWTWAWADSGITGAIHEKAESIKALGDKTCSEIFNLETLQADEGLAWEIAALACDHYQGEGVFAAPVSGLLFFMVLSNVTKV